MVKAASLFYAIFISVIIAILCAGLLFLFNLKLELDNHFNTKTDLINHNRATISKMLVTENPVLENTLDYETYNNLGINLNRVIVPWGVLKVCIIESIQKKDTIHQRLLLGKKQSKDKPALYLRNNDEPLKISGEAIILGDIYGSSQGVKKVNITSNSNNDNPQHIGEALISDKQLPELQTPSFSYPDEFIKLSFEDIQKNSLNNNFKKTTILLEAKKILADVSIKGKIIIQSSDTLFIEKTAILEDVIIIAPKIVYKSGFVGNTQSFASTSVVVSENANLKYPSIIVVDKQNNQESSINIQNGALVEGAIVIAGNGLSTEDKHSVTIAEDAIVRGDIYCNGILSLYGTVEGSVVTSSLLYRSKNTSYSNMISGGKIFGNKLPETFFQLPLTKSFESVTSVAIKQL